jgi:hypothetical protein
MAEPVWGSMGRGESLPFAEDFKPGVWSAAANSPIWRIYLLAGLGVLMGYHGIAWDTMGVNDTGQNYLFYVLFYSKMQAVISLLYKNGLYS